MATRLRAESYLSSMAENVLFFWLAQKQKKTKKSQFFFNFFFGGQKFLNPVAAPLLTASSEL
jgi:hypothetical protein